MEGIILSGVGGQYTVFDGSDRFRLRAQAKLRRQRLTPLVGDRVRFTPGKGGQDGWLEEILPRRTVLVRPAVANVTVIALVIASVAPQPDFLLIDRLLMACRAADIAPLIVVNKCDEGTDMSRRVEADYAFSGAKVYSVSAHTGEGIETLRQRLRGELFAMAGQSGVGKSSLLNALYGLGQETGSLSEKIERGKNTTRHSLLTPVEGGGMALDTPGFSFFELPLTEPGELSALVPEFAPYEGQCRFKPCRHRSEPGCAVIAAVKGGSLSEARWTSYCTILDDMTQKWRGRYD